MEMKYASKKTAMETIKKTLPKTAYAEGTIRLSEMKVHLLYTGFGTNETNFILSAMVAAGAKFIVED